MRGLSFLFSHRGGMTPWLPVEPLGCGALRNETSYAHGVLTACFQEWLLLHNSARRYVYSWPSLYQGHGEGGEATCARSHHYERLNS